ncbi:MAG: C40 family peptidase [Bacteroidales bacterium]|nr:C40 family peptidase [Bacteroidales bacterium]
MKKTTILLFVGMVFCFSCSTVKKATEKNIKQKIQEIKNEFIPDTRVKIFEVEVASRKGKLYLEGATSSKEAYEKIEETTESSTGKNLTNRVKLLPDDNLESVHGIINLSVGNIRSKPNHASTLITQALMGTPVKIYEKDGWWYRIQTPDRYIGWIDASGIRVVSKTKLKNWKQSGKIIFTGHYGSVYKTKSRDASPVSDVVMGDILKLEKNSNHWYGVSFPDGRSGYLMKRKAMTISEWEDQTEVTGESIADLARSFMGIPYLWGGTSIKGLDCSGFVKTVYFMHGIILQRDASQQTKHGELIPVKDNYEALKPGDLLFFGENRVTHVGIYIGDHQFIHSSGLVKINSLNENDPNYNEARANSLIRVRRIVNSLGEKGISLFKENPYYQ